MVGGAGPMVSIVDLTDYDINNPPATITTPLWTVTGVGTQFVHSITVRNGRLYCCAWGSGLWVYDVSRVRTQMPTLIGTVEGENVHTCWPTEDGKYVVTAEEKDHGGIKLFEINNLANGMINLSERDSIILPIANAYSVHNPIFVGDRLYVAWYQSGLHVFDLNRQTRKLDFAGSYDTFADQVQGFDGNWGVYPFLGPDKVLLSDITNGLYVVNVAGPAQINPTLPKSLHPVFTTPVHVSVTDTMDPIEPDSVTLNRVLPGNPEANIAMTNLGGGQYEATLPKQKCSEPLDYYFSAQTMEGETVYSPLGAPVRTYQLRTLTAEVDVIRDSFETATGWTVGSPDDDATGGQWVRGIPNGTSAQPSSGAPYENGLSCFFTGQGAIGAADDAADVDRGKTSVRSPIFAATDGDYGFGFSYWYYSEFGGFFASDGMEVSISNDGGATWRIVDRIYVSAAEWNDKKFRIADFITPSATMQVRFTAFDLGPRSIVEAAIDEFVVFKYVCSEEYGDNNGDGFVDLIDYQGFPECFHGLQSGVVTSCLIFDTAFDGDVDLRDFKTFQSSFTGSP